MEFLLSVEAEGSRRQGLLPDEPPFLEGVLRLSRLVQATWLALLGEGPQLRDSAGFSPDFAASRRRAH
jgi:hypothetical protein